MNNKISKRIKLLIMAVLVLFVAVAILDIAPEFGAGYKVGYEAGREDARAMMFGGKRHLFSIVTPIDPADHPTQKFTDRVEVRTLKTYGDVIVTVDEGSGASIWAQLATGLFALMIMGMMLAFIVHFVIFAVKFPRRRVMARENVVSLRWIAALLGTIGLSTYLLELMHCLWLRANVVLEGYQFEIPSPPSALMVALVIWVMTEILNLAGRLQNEQDLTI